jgi:hypothetical protein
MTTLSFKVSATEARRIRSLAQHEKLSLSEYLRRRASGRPNNPVKPGRVRCPLTGALVFAPLPGHPPLTTEAVNQILGDFP